MVGFAQRGLRNNNPFNIKKSKNSWYGKKEVSSDRTFEQFTCMLFGIRAGMILLRNYVNKGIDTPRKIIDRFAPRCENATAAYLNYIVRDSRNITFIGADEVITSLSVLCRLASRMVQFENALTPISLANIGCDPKQLLQLCNYYKIDLK